MKIKLNKIWIIFFIVILIIVTTIYLYYKNNQKNNNDILISQTSEPNSSAYTEKVKNEIEETNKILKKNMYVYKDEDFGVEMLVPKTVYEDVYEKKLSDGYNGIMFHNINTDYDSIEIPTKIIRDDLEKSFYIVPDYKRYCDESGCEDEPITLETIKQDKKNYDFNFAKGEVKLFNAKNSQEVEAIIQNLFNDESCQYFFNEDDKNMTEWKFQEGVYDIDPDYVGSKERTEKGEYPCVNAGYPIILYCPKNQQLIMMAHGQQAVFLYEINGKKHYYDDIIRDSIRFFDPL